MSCRVVALISGRGSNLQTLLDGAASGRLPITLAAVISNRPAAPGLDRAREAGVAAIAVDHRHRRRVDFEAELTATIDDFRPDLVVLAGFMRILEPATVAHYQGRMLNIHPSLLPNYRGLDTHARAIEAGDQHHGASVHFVTPELDSGPTIAQIRVPILADDDPERLAARVLVQEHRLYPLVVGWFAQGRVSLDAHQVRFDGYCLAQPILLESDA